ncbi:DNA polymerase III subunit epsilon [Corynebacterium glaucum]|uniref:DNA polymerase III subunit epsilon n=1 Tax=Corynebacterium glaucum TaxID=187491 RepID=UPI00265B6639|nr:DNA polymerase III subunit epsilon [Corynebacterium glaucum]
MTAPNEPAHPYVVLNAQTTGIHPGTGRLLTLDAVTFNEAGEIGEEFHQVFNPGCDPGPRHIHGLEVGDFAQAPRFARSLRTLNKLIDGRVLVLYDSPRDWGFVVSEARRAMNAAARANRSRRGKGNRRRQRVGHVPRPSSMVDVLGSARLQGFVPVDARLQAVAPALGVGEPSNAGASDAAANGAGARADRHELEQARMRANTLMLMQLFLQLRGAGALTELDPSELTADAFGLQRSHVRVDAQKAGAAAENPGVYAVYAGLHKGMEVVVTDDVAVRPDTLIDAAVRAGLTYSEKLSRQTSLVVSDAQVKGVELRGKAMHAHRKDIPILSAEEFTRAVAEMESGSGARPE